MACPALPDELIDLVFQYLDAGDWYLRHGKHYLSQCSLVCRAWTVTARRRSFTTLKVNLRAVPASATKDVRSTHSGLSEPTHNVEDPRRIRRFIEFLRSSPHIASLVQTLSLQDKGNHLRYGELPACTAEDLCDVVHLLPSLHALSLSDIGIWAPLPPSPLWHSLQVEDLVILDRVQTHYGPQVLNVLALFSSARSLKLDHLQLVEEWDDKENDEDEDMSENSDGDEGLNLPLELFSIRTLTLQLVEIPRVGLLLDLLASAGALTSVQHLTIDHVATRLDLASLASVLADGASHLTRLNLDGGFIFSKGTLHAPNDRTYAPPVLRSTVFPRASY